MRVLPLRMLGALILVGLQSLTTSGQTYVGPGEVLPVLGTPRQDFVLDGGTLAPSGVTALRGIELLSDSSILRPQNPLRLDGRGELFEPYLGSTNLARVISGVGGLTLGNESRDRIEINADNTYGGKTTIVSGQVNANSATPFGATSVGTTIQGGAVNILAPTREPFRIEAGELKYSADTLSADIPLTVAGGVVEFPRQPGYALPIVADGAGGQVVFGARQGDSATWTGGSTGAGSLFLDGVISVDAPLAHDGDLTIRGGVLLNVVNAYQGRTILAGNYVIDRPDVFGVSSTPIEVHENASVVVDVLPNGDRGFLVQRGSLTLNVGTPAASKITLDRGQLTATGLSVMGAIELTGRAAALRSGDYYGGAIGSAISLTLGSDAPVVLHTDGTYAAKTLLSGTGTVTINSPAALGSVQQGTYVGSNRLILNASTNEPVVVAEKGVVELNAQQARLPRLATTRQFDPPRTQAVVVNHVGSYLEDVDIVEGSLQVNADLTINDAVVRQGGKLAVTPGASLHVRNSDIELQSGRIDGSLTGVSLIRKTTGVDAELGALPGYAGAIRVEEGRLKITSPDSFGTTAGATHVVGPGAVVDFNQTGVVEYDEEILLDNATGDLWAPGMFASRGRVRLNGRLDLGERSSTLGGKVIELAGPITGGDLVTRGDEFRLEITTPDADYTGATEVVEAVVVVAGAGRLNNTSVIRLHEATDFRNGTLDLNNRGVKINDRIPDGVPLEFKGGALVSNGELDEVVGAARFVEGDSLVDLFPSSTERTFDKQLTLASLARERGAVARIDVSPTAQAHVTELPELTHGILPWLIAVDHQSSSNRIGLFASFSERGIVPVTIDRTNLNAAVASDHVAVTSSTTTLSREATIASLSFDASHTTIDLGGQTLNIETGGLNLANGGQLSNGRLSTGAQGLSELLIYGRGGIGADIVESGAPLDLTLTPGAQTYDIYLSGTNSYTGTTYVNEGTVVFQSVNSLPAGTNLSVAGGVVELDYAATEVKQLDTIRVTQGGSIEAGFGSQNSLAFQQLILERGLVSEVNLAGEGEIVKTTSGNAFLRTGIGSTFSGRVVVEQGHLGASAFADARFVVTGGSLGLYSSGATVELAGGELLVGPSTFSSRDYSANSQIHVSAASRIVVERYVATGVNSALNRPISGGGDLAFTGRGLIQPRQENLLSISSSNPDFTGDVNIDSVTVNLRQADALGSGAITVSAGGVLQLDSRDIDEHTLHNEVYLQSGELRGLPQFQFQQQIGGALYVSGQSRVGGVEVAGPTFLADNSRLTAVTDELLQFRGPIYVSGYAELEYGVEVVETNFANLNAGITQLLGEIRSDAAVAVLNLVDRGLDEAVVDVILHAETGQSLTLLKGGAPMELALAGEGAALVGGGVLGNDVVLADGASVSPGESPGLLTIDGDARLGGGSRFVVELGGVLRGSGYDALDVLGDASIDGALLELSLVDGFSPLPTDEFLILQAASLGGRFLDAEERIRVGNYLFDVKYQTDGVVLANVATIPEPSAFTLLLLAGAARRSRARLLGYVVGNSWPPGDYARTTRDS
ncbi:hypothetical protein KOR34_05080 [Posidoniimonas corsicana]|uniref:Autotransporter-associated beta strand repeat protein n=1 Tax=Posidoniimonas corsicana TaxID=1938618 RepID=A0A5C5VAJ1_9BACT|nr:hypothetical protein [Posidoniimonas corsicana]TWT35614.1 hypothetical protein KOR34_05080 [Posidoniimonas corsicana]